MASVSGIAAAEPLIQASLLGEAIDAGPLAVFVFDDAMQYIAVNEYAASLLGYERSELLALSVTDVAVGPDVVSRFQALLLARRGDGEATLRRRDGIEIRVQYRASETRVAGIPLYVGVAWPTD